MVFAQGIGEYGGASGGLVEIFAGSVASAGNWLITSWTQDRPFWIVGICLVIAFWVFRRR